MEGISRSVVEIAPLLETSYTSSNGSFLVPGQGPVGRALLDRVPRRPVALRQVRRGPCGLSKTCPLGADAASRILRSPWPFVGSRVDPLAFRRRVGGARSLLVSVPIAPLTRRAVLDGACSTRPPGTLSHLACLSCRVPSAARTRSPAIPAPPNRKSPRIGAVS